MVPWLFQRTVPPVLTFALGSLTNFVFNGYKPVTDATTDNGIRVNLCMRFTCTVYRAIAEKEAKRRKAVKKYIPGEILLMKDLERGGWEAFEGGYPRPPRLMAGKIRRSSVSRQDRWRHLKSSMISLWIAWIAAIAVFVSLLELFGTCIPPIVPQTIMLTFAMQATSTKL